MGEVEGFIIEEDSAPLALAFLHLRSAFSVAPVDRACARYFIEALEAFRAELPANELGARVGDAVEVHIREGRAILRELRHEWALAIVREHNLLRNANHYEATGVFLWAGKPAGLMPVVWPKGVEVPEGARALLIAANSDEAPVVVIENADGSVTARDGARSIALGDGVLARETAAESARFDVHGVGEVLARDVAERELSRWSRS
ncbi:MAG: hypothetical protein JNK05_17820 [Myxococcales bacterium]|nr:hypothetical protein [Myxococcales bacterium]